MIPSGVQRSARVRVEGLVQGVGYRYSAYHMAKSLRLRGWVRNECDGAVVAEFEGDANAVQSFIDWLKAGPPGARVDRVQVRELPPRGQYAAFTIEY